MRITATQSVVQIRIEAFGGKFGHLLGDREDTGPFGAGSVSRGVARAVVHDDDLVDEVRSTKPPPPRRVTHGAQSALGNVRGRSNVLIRTRSSRAAEGQAQ
jgi:hypothetical protein